MTDLSNDAGLWATRALGASAGAAVSLVYLLRKSRREAASRFFTGLACGTIFGGPTGIWIAERLALADRLSASEVALSGSAAAGICAWWGLGILSRLAGRYGARALAGITVYNEENIMTASRALVGSPMGADTRKFANLELRGLKRDGSFSGYASVFGEVDLGKDAIERGAFRKSLAERGACGVRMLFQHDPAEPIGAWKTIREDSRGLYVEGMLAEGVARAREVHQLLKSGALDGLSIGFRTVRAKTDAKSGVRRIFEADLWEISVVTFPMLPSARVQNIKNARWFRDKETELVRAMRRAARMMLTETFR